MSALLLNHSLWAGLLLLGSSVSAAPIWQRWSPGSSLAVSPVFCEQTPPSVSRLILPAEVRYSLESASADIPLSIEGTIYGGLPFGESFLDIPPLRYRLYCDGADMGELPQTASIFLLDRTIAVKSAASWHFESGIDASLRPQVLGLLNSFPLGDGSHQLSCRPSL